MSQLDGATRKRIAANIFPIAHDAIRSWEAFPWHRDRGGRPTTYVPWSSQALAIDVFGTVSMLPAKTRILNLWMAYLGLSRDDDWNICLEWQASRRLLNEPRPTQVDAVARGRKQLILFECKFTEASGGACSQPKRLAAGSAKGKIQCNGAYMQQRNPVNDIESSCSLTGKQIRYWDWIPDVIGYDNTQTHEPCPFAGSSFQWMRNLVVAAAEGHAAELRPAFVLVHAGALGSDTFPVAREVKSAAWQDIERRAAKGPVALRVASYTRLLDHAIAGLPDVDTLVLKELRSWVERKETIAVQRQSSSPKLE